MGADRIFVVLCDGDWRVVGIAYVGGDVACAGITIAAGGGGAAHRNTLSFLTDAGRGRLHLGPLPVR
jgi:hypothetical protein